ncbi:hypothetical protein PRECH8_01200 [Insulibacter thermoxylanivorax]|uniref:Uncharacterized protein n=1 Tax=Insulibacter thermoxylanivorax TaxID=2749268 RepID=A0A916QC44_9BACL|nr:hypothetical protein PRECH8_01200 [Insulibacter thermoxylanivorax]
MRKDETVNAGTVQERMRNVMKGSLFHVERDYARCFDGKGRKQMSQYACNR